MSVLKVGELIERLVIENPYWSNQQVAKEVRRQIPWAKCTAASVSSTKSRMPKNSANSSDGQESNLSDETAIEPQLFPLEKQMQEAVRKQLDELEPGLVEDDGGEETRIATGWIDIVARDKDGKLVVIELKAGQCPESAPTQVLGYAQDLEDKRGENVRAYLIAGSFSERTHTAARRMIGLELRTYEFNLRFNTLTDQ